MNACAHCTEDINWDPLSECWLHWNDGTPTWFCMDGSGLTAEPLL